MDFQQAGFPTASGLAQQGTLTLAHYILARPRLTLRFPALGSWAQKINMKATSRRREAEREA
jgi:hypothetical protein